MTVSFWTDKIRLPGWGRAAGGAGQNVAVSFEGEQFRYLLTQDGPAGGRRRLLRWGGLPREQQTDARWASCIRALRLGGPVTAMLGPHQYQLLTVDLPPVPDDELAAAARWRIKDMIQMPLDQVTTDVLRLPSPGGAPARQMLVVVAPNEAIRQTMLQAQAAGLALAAIDIPELGLRNLASAQQPVGAVATLVAEGSECWFSLCEGGELLAQRRFPYDGESGVSERVVSELQRSIDRLERQFPELRLSALLVELGAWTADYVATLGGVTQLSCQALRPAALFDTEGLDTLDASGDLSWLALAGLGLRAEASPVTAS